MAFLITLVVEPLIQVLYAAAFPAAGLNFGLVTLTYYLTAGSILLLSGLIAYRYVWDPLGMLREARRSGGATLLNHLPELDHALTLEIWDIARKHDIRKEKDQAKVGFYSRQAEVIGIAKFYARRIYSTYDTVSRLSDDIQVYWLISLIFILIMGVFVPFAGGALSLVVLVLTLIIGLVAAAFVIGSVSTPPPFYSLKSWKAEVKDLYYRDDPGVRRKLMEWAEQHPPSEPPKSGVLFPT